MCQPAWEACEAARRFRRKNCQQQWGNEDFAEDKSKLLTDGLVCDSHHTWFSTEIKGCTTPAVHALHHGGFPQQRQKPEVHWWTEWVQGELLRCSRRGVIYLLDMKYLKHFIAVSGYLAWLLRHLQYRMAKCSRLLHRNCHSSAPSPAPRDTDVPAEVTRLAGLKTTLNSLKFCSYRDIGAVQPSEWSVSFTRRTSLNHVLWLQSCLNNSLLFFPFKMICRPPVELIFLIFGFSWRVNFCSQAAENQLFLHHA